MPTKHNFDQVVKKYSELKRKLPKLIGNEAVNFALDNFRKQGWQDGHLYPWKKRRPGATRNSGRAILVDTGRGRRSIRVGTLSNNRVTIVGIDYMGAHNEGAHITGPQNVRSHTRRYRGRRVNVRRHQRHVNIRLPRRRFIGDSVTLNNRINRMVKLKLLKVFKSS